MDGTMTVPQLLERQLEKSPDHPAYFYDGPDSELVSIRFAQYVRTVQAASAIIQRDMAPLIVDDKSPVVGIFAVLGWLVQSLFSARHNVFSSLQIQSHTVSIIL
jgi:hypothetical protein